MRRLNLTNWIKKATFAQNLSYFNISNYSDGFDITPFHWLRCFGYH